MSLESLPVHRGLRVPYVAAWTGEEDISQAVVAAAGALWYVDPLVDAACRWQGALWRGLMRALGEGTPIFEALHPVRQRRAMWEQLCQVCGVSVAEEAAERGGALYLGGAEVVVPGLDGSLSLSWLRFPLDDASLFTAPDDLRSVLEKLLGPLETASDLGPVAICSFCSAPSRDVKVTAWGMPMSGAGWSRYACRPCYEVIDLRDALEEL
ncbi:hypothetical protein [Streptomyces roseolus]|uniref:hypothetical protein n=1 Tax=Streptomyces roseolus TaxID=67358 RepID=UPI0036E88C60